MSMSGIVAAIVLVLVNAFFVAAEYSVVAVRRTRVDELVAQGKRTALIVQRIKQNLESYLTASQLGVTLASLGLGSVGEPAIAAMIEPIFAARLGPLVGKSVANIIGVAVAFTSITYMHIVFGELGPKWVAIGKPDRIALLTAVPFEFFYRACYPLVRLITVSGGFLLRPMGVKPMGENESALSEEELRQVISESQEAQAIPEVAEEIAERAFHFGRGRVRDVMTPRPEVVYLTLGQPLDEMLDKVQRTSYARFPVCRGDLENVIGRVHVRDLLSLARDFDRLTEKQVEIDQVDARLQAACGLVLFVPENKPLDAMLDDFRAQRMEMAIVQDEYGVTAGVVTLEDVLEELVGEIQQEFAPTPSEVQALPDGSYMVDYKVTLARLVREYHIGSEVPDIETIGGYVLATLPGNPRIGDKTRLDDWQAEVTELAGRRIRRLRLSPIQTESTTENTGDTEKNRGE
jgi:CBS domain containing-hemolysin-like protein